MKHPMDIEYTFVCPQCSNVIHKKSIVCSRTSILCKPCNSVFTFDTGDLTFDAGKVIGVKKYKEEL